MTKHRIAAWARRAMRFTLMALSFICVTPPPAPAKTFPACTWLGPVLEAAADEIARTYVIADAAEKIAADVRRSARDGDYAAYCTSPSDFAAAFESDLKARDAHFRVDAPNAAQPDAAVDWVADWRRKGQAENGGIRSAQVLDGNIGYLRVASFHAFDLAAPKLDAALRFLADTRGLIVDLRQNGGGDGETAGQLLATLSAPDAKPVLAEETRRGRTSMASVTTKLPRYAAAKPIIVLVDRRSASAAEAIAWTLQAQGRARIFGDRTFGAAHITGGPKRLPLAFTMTVPEARPVDLRTGTSWERRGVTPDVRTGEDPVWAAANAITATLEQRAR